MIVLLFWNCEKDDRLTFEPLDFITEDCGNCPKVTIHIPKALDDKPISSIINNSVQEEVGLRGARTAAFAIRPDIGFGIDTTLACDTPGVPDTDATTRQGEGFGLHVKDSSFIADRMLVKEIEALAKKEDIPYQRTLLAAGGQDGAAAQQAAAGARAVGIVVGTRYIHTVTEMIEKGDLEAAKDILVAYLSQT